MSSFLLPQTLQNLLMLFIAKPTVLKMTTRLCLCLPWSHPHFIASEFPCFHLYISLTILARLWDIPDFFLLQGLVCAVLSAWDILPLKNGIAAPPISFRVSHTDLFRESFSDHKVKCSILPYFILTFLLLSWPGIYYRWSIPIGNAWIQNVFRFQRFYIIIWVSFVLK